MRWRGWSASSSTLWSCVPTPPAIPASVNCWHACAPSTWPLTCALQDLPFERLVEILNPVRSTAHHPLFQVMLALQNTADESLGLHGLTVAPQPASGFKIAKFDLELRIYRAAHRRRHPRRTDCGDRVRV